MFWTVGIPRAPRNLASWSGQATACPSPICDLSCATPFFFSVGAHARSLVFLSLFWSPFPVFFQVTYSANLKQVLLYPLVCLVCFQFPVICFSLPRFRGLGVQGRPRRPARPCSFLPCPGSGQTQTRPTSRLRFFFCDSVFRVLNRSDWLSFVWICGVCCFPSFPGARCGPRSKHETTGLDEKDDAKINNRKQRDETSQRAGAKIKKRLDGGRQMGGEQNSVGNARFSFRFLFLATSVLCSGSSTQIMTSPSGLNGQ